MKLYYIPLTRAIRPQWLLEEMELSYDLIQVTPEMSRSFEYRKLHPHGKVPVFVDDAVTIFESAAICTYLADKYLEKGFAPNLDSPERAYYFQWIFYASVTLETPVEKYLFYAAPHLPEELLPRDEKIDPSSTKQWFVKVCEPLNEHLKKYDYLVGNTFTTADVVTGGVLFWAFKLNMLPNNSLVASYLSRLMERPAFQRIENSEN